MMEKSWPLIFSNICILYYKFFAYLRKFKNYLGMQKYCYIKHPEIYYDYSLILTSLKL